MKAKLRKLRKQDLPFFARYLTRLSLKQITGAGIATTLACGEETLYTGEDADDCGGWGII